MRESYGTTFITIMAIVLIFLFSGYIAISIKYSKAFKAKNEIITIIEKYGGVDSAEDVIKTYLNGIGYDATGTCPTGWASESIRSDGRPSYCYQQIYNPYKSGYCYYKFKLFFKFGLPIIDDIATFDVEGETVDLKI